MNNLKKQVNCIGAKARCMTSWAFPTAHLGQSELLQVMWSLQLLGHRLLSYQDPIFKHYKLSPMTNKEPHWTYSSAKVQLVYSTALDDRAEISFYYTANNY